MKTYQISHWKEKQINMGAKNGLASPKRMPKVYLPVLKRWKCLASNKHLAVVTSLSHHGVSKPVEKNKIKHFPDNACNCLHH